MTRHRIEGHAIVSAQGCYADANGAMPDALRCEADWRRFQTALDRAALTVMGRNGHQANPNIKARKRLVVSRSARQRSAADRGDPNVFWVEPDAATLRAALNKYAPLGGCIAVVGGTGVFELFLALGYEEFHLVVAARVNLPGGRPLFNGCNTLQSCLTRLRGNGLELAEVIDIDRENDVLLHAYRRTNIDTDISA